MDKKSLWLWSYFLIFVIICIWLQMIYELLLKGKVTIIYQEAEKPIATDYRVKEISDVCKEEKIS